MKTLQWTPRLASQFWGDLAGTEFLERIAFSRFASSYLVDLVWSYLRANDPILDYGSGHNLYLVQELLSRGLTVGYYELSEASAGRQSSLAGQPGFLGAVRDIDAQQFRTVFLSEVVEHLQDDELACALNRANAALKPGGTLVVTTPENEDLFTQSRYCPCCRHLFHPWGHVRSFTAAQLESLLREHGFTCVELHAVDFSSTREPIEDCKYVKERLSDIVRALEGIVQKARTDHPGISHMLHDQVNRLSEYSVSPSPEEPNRRRIGLGGTLVAITTKTRGTQTG